MKTHIYQLKGLIAGFLLGVIALGMITVSASESHSTETFTATDSAGIVWTLEERPESLVIARTYPNGVTVSVVTNDIMCNRLESDTQAVTTMDLEISEIYFLFHKHLDKVTGKTEYRIQLSQDRRSQLSIFKQIRGDFCLFH